MKIICCLKAVAGRDLRHQIRDDGRWIREDGNTLEINECDEYGLEEALKLQEKHGGEVALVTLGRVQAEKSMRKGLAMGAGRGVLIVDEEDQAQSPHAVASALAEVIRREEYDLILCGTQSDDYSYAQTGVMLAEYLDLPHATIVMEINVDPEATRVKALSELENGRFQWVELSLPAVLTIQSGISQIRYASLRGIMQAKRKEIRQISLSDLEIDWKTLPMLELVGLSLPETDSKAEMLKGDASQVAAQLVDKFKKDAKVL